MSRDDRSSGDQPTDLVELTRVQPFEAQVITARLRTSGIEAISGAESPYDSISFAEGIPIWVPADEASRARALLDDEDLPQ